MVCLGCRVSWLTQRSVSKELNTNVDKAEDLTRDTNVQRDKS